MFKEWSHAFEKEGLVFRGVYTEPTGKPLLHFIHGNGFCALTYEPMLLLLAQHFDLWLCDVQGHGNSDAGESFLGWNQNAELAAQAFRAHLSLWEGVPRFAVGHSFGGVLTTLICAKHKDLFQKAALLDPVMFTPSILLMMTALRLAGKKRATPMAKSALRRKRVWANRQEAFGALNNRGTYKNWAPEAMWAFVTHALADTADGKVQLKTPANIEADIFSSGPKHLWPLVKKIQCPVRVIYGDTTYDFVGEAATRACKFNKQFSKQRLHGGHCFMQEQPHVAAQAVLDYLLGDDAKLHLSDEKKLATES